MTTPPRPPTSSASGRAEDARGGAGVSGPDAGREPDRPLHGVDPVAPGHAVPGHAVRRAAPLVTLAVVVAALLLRSPLVTVAPVADQVGAGLGAGPELVGLLISVPVLCFAVCAPLAVALVRTAGASFALTVSVVGIGLGTLVRSLDGVPTALVGTVLLGVAIAMANVVVPVLISREYAPSRRAVMTGVYTAAINLGTMTVTLTTAPLADVVGWRTAIAGWAVLVLAVVAAWIGAQGVRGALLPSAGALLVPVTHATAGRTPATVWLLALAFAGQAFAYYGTTSWLPSILADQGFPAAEAGAISSIFQAAGIGGALLVPLLVRVAGLRWNALLIGLGWLTLPIGMLLAPGLWAVWCVLGGLGQAGGFATVFTILAALDGGDRRTATWSGIVQGAGYTVAAAAPVAVGALRTVTGSWDVPLLAILAAALTFGLTVTAAASSAERRAAGSPPVPAARKDERASTADRAVLPPEATGPGAT